MKGHGFWKFFRKFADFRNFQNRFKFEKNLETIWVNKYVKTKQTFLRSLMWICQWLWCKDTKSENFVEVCTFFGLKKKHKNRKVYFKRFVEWSICYPNKIVCENWEGTVNNFGVKIPLLRSLSKYANWNTNRNKKRLVTALTTIHLNKLALKDLDESDDSWQRWKIFLCVYRHTCKQIKRLTKILGNGVSTFFDV